MSLFASLFLKQNPLDLPEYSHSSRIIETEIGREFVIVLESNPTTGYGWRLSSAFDKKMLEVTEIRHHAAPTDRVGAGGKDRWTFKGLQEGTSILVLEYARPWEKDVLPIKSENFTVRIKKAKSK